MNNIWSENKYINIVINILIFLLGINIMHYGQLLLPLICLLLFINNKFRFKVNNIKIFIVLCLFSISFFAFSYKLGFYSVMGFTLPMAYYIGSNMYKPDEKKVKFVIYIIAFGMASYFILNMIYEYSRFGLFGLFYKVNRYDIWTKSSIKSTTISMYSILLLSTVPYAIFLEHNKKWKIFHIFVVVVALIYCSILGKRTPILLTAIVFFFSFVLEAICFKNKSNLRKVLKVILIIATLVLIAILLVYFDVFNIMDRISDNNIIKTFLYKGLNADRFIIFIWGFKYIPKYLWGGQYISNLIGYPFHDLLFDIYDYAGIIPFVLMSLQCIHCIEIMFRTFVNKNISNDNKLLYLCVMLSISIMMFMEPIMTGCSIFLICSTIIFAAVESLTKSGKGNV